MKRKAHFFKVFVIAIAASTVVGFVLMFLWNTIIPEVLGFKTITFWQALGLFILTRLLFGGHFGAFRRRHDLRHELHNRWMKMSPEERQAFFEKGRFHFPSFRERGTEGEQPGN